MDRPTPDTLVRIQAIQHKLAEALGCFEALPGHEHLLGYAVDGVYSALGYLAKVERGLLDAKAARALGALFTVPSHTSAEVRLLAELLK